MEFRCPTCNTLLYSRRARLCGHCNAVLPEELRLSDEEARARDEDQERVSARKLAAAFSSKLPGSDHRSPNDTPLSAAELIARAETADTSSNGDFAEQFKHRKRKWFWVPGAVLCLFVIPIIFIVSKSGKSMTSALVASAIILATSVLRAWHRAAPICPHCRQNIRHCAPSHCHLCGDPLNDKRCRECRVDHSWLGKLSPRSNSLTDWIAYCPGCGVYLDTHIRRWSFGRNND